MKVILDENRLLEIMKENGVKSYRQLCRECGINPKTFYQSKFYGYISKENYWLIADRLHCHIEDLQTVDWSI